MIPTAADADADWLIVDDGGDVLRARDVEARLSIGNGFLGSRGARDVGRGPAWVSATPSLTPLSWPRSYIAGLYDTPDAMPGVPVLMPVPDWSRIRVQVNGVTLRGAARQSLDLRHSLLMAECEADPAVHLRSLRFISAADRAVAVQVVEIAARADCTITLEAWFDTAMVGLQQIETGAGFGAWRGERSPLCAGIAAEALLWRGGQRVAPAGRGDLRWTWQAVLNAGDCVQFERRVALAREVQTQAGAQAGAQAQAALTRTGIGWRALLDAHQSAWAARWQASEVRIDGDEQAARVLRFVVHHLSTAANPADAGVSIGARGMTGDGYLGHVFWDTEIYMLPFFSLTWPEAARAMLRYRHARLAGARVKAAALGYRGAMFPWESADTGLEETPDSVTGADGRPAVVRTGHQEQHITADIAYAVWQHWLITGDTDFLRREAADILVETARFWASRVERAADKSCHISGVIGPDEFHEGVRDNAFTNEMARWNIARGLEVAAMLNLPLDPAELADWRFVAEHIARHCDAAGVFDQHDGFRTAPPDPARGGRDIKQADVVALAGLLPEVFADGAVARNFDIYAPRCAHESSLSRPMHAVVAARLGRVAEALRLFHDAAALDLNGPAGSDTAGLHMAALGGLWQAAVLGFGGVSWPGGVLHIRPNLPEGWTQMEFRLQFQGREIALCIGPTGVVPRLLAGAEIGIVLGETPVTLRLQHGG